MDEVDLGSELQERELQGKSIFQRKRKMDELTPNERAQLNSAWRLRVTAKQMLNDCEDPRVIPVLKEIYFDSIKRYREVYKRLGVE